MIRKVGGKYQLKAKSTGQNLGTFKTKKEAQEREREIQYFKHKKKGK